MTPILEAFKQQLSNNELSSYYAEQLFSGMSEAIKNDLTKILQSTIQRYASIPVISAVLSSSTDPSSHLRAICDIFPTTFFHISNDLYRETEFFKSAKLLQIAGIAASLTRSPDQTSHIQLFIDSIDSADSLDELKKKISDQNLDSSYIPKIINNDIIRIRKTYKNLVITKDIYDLIDMLFGFQGLLQVYLKFYFELICSAGNDTAAHHIDSIFQNLFATLKYQEIKFWNNYSDSSTLQKQLYYIINTDSPSQRHPVLRKHLFDSLKQYNPIIKDARSIYTAPDVQKLHKRQLADYNALSIPRLFVLLRTISHCKGKSNLVYLLSQTLKNENQKLFQLNKLIQQEGSKSDKELADLVQYFVDKLSQTQKRANQRSSKTSEVGMVIQTAESLRKLEAQKLLKEREARGGGLTYDQVNRLMQEKFRKMYLQVKTGDTLTTKNASDHLTKFATIAQPLLTLPVGQSQTQAIKQFQMSTQQMLKEICDKGHLTEEEANLFKTNITKKSKKLVSASTEDQVVIMEQIGMVLTNASNRSQKRYQIKQKRSQVKKKEQQTLTYDKVTKFLENRLSELYKRVKKDGALTHDKVSQYLAKFSETAQPLLLEITAEQQKEEIEKFKVSTGEILKGFSKDGSLSKKSVNQFKNEIQQLTIQLDTPDIEKRTQLIQEIGITLSIASAESDQSKSTVSDNGDFKQVGSKPLTQGQIASFLEDHLKKLYARAKKDGALTYDQIASYLSQFAEAAQKIVIDIPAGTRNQTIAEFKNSTDNILTSLSRTGSVTPKQHRVFTTIMHREIKKLDVDNVQERVQIVDKIGLILADASDASIGKKEEAFDEEFYKKDLIPYGLDSSAKLISMDSFFAFPFGDRKGPNEKSWFDYHIRYLKMAMEKNKLKQPDFEKISNMLPHVPKKKYRKYFNIFPSEKFEETTFLAVYDLWQNKALDRLVIEP
ncbi:MAG: hypothetical protein HQ517_04515 [SAR324 cluster bacterium]|nr:hypothetical protein [SAR324 cluster bacterium]